MTDKEQQMLQWVDEIRVEVYEAIKHLSTALRKLAALAVLIIAKMVDEDAPEPAKIDKEALDIIAEPIADEVPLQAEESKEEPKPKRKKKIRLDDYDTPLEIKHEGTDRVDRMKYWRKCGKTLAWIAKQEHCSPQTVLNILNREKAKEAQKIKSEAAYSDPEGGKQ